MRYQLFVMLLFGALVVGCIGRKIEPENIRQLQPGMTFDQVVAIMGPPYMTLAGQPPDDSTMATWVHSNAFTGAQSLTLRFDGDGKLIKVPAGAVFSER
jgi:hypothetical protein